MEKRVEQVLEALRKNNFEALYFDSEEEACSEVLKKLPIEQPVGVSGSVTLAQLGILESLADKGYTVYTHAAAKDKAEGDALRRKANSCYYYLTGINALTEDGMLVNMDGAGNRVSALSFGPKEVIALCGTNKIVRDYPEGIERIKDIAGPANAKRLGLDTPCVQTGKCEDCSSPRRICNIVSVMQKKPGNRSVTVVLVKGKFGY